LSFQNGRDESCSDLPNPEQVGKTGYPALSAINPFGARTSSRAEVQFDSIKNQFALVQRYIVPETDSKELSRLLSEIGDWIISRKKRMTKEERSGSYGW